MKPGGGGTKIPGALSKAMNSDLGGYDKFKADFVQAGTTQFGSGWAWLGLRDGKLKIAQRRTAKIRWFTAALRSSASTWSTPTTSTTATAAPTISMPSSTA